MEKIYSLADEQVTTAWGKAIGSCIPNENSIALCGEMGAGKTHLVKGIALGMGIEDTITSPTFTICNQYICQDRVLNHFDLYRLEDVEELYGIGFYEMFYDSVTVVEWADLFAEELPANSVWIELSKESPTERRMKVRVPETAKDWWKEVEAYVVSH